MVTKASGIKCAPATPTLPEAEDESPRSLLCLVGKWRVRGLRELLLGLKRSPAVFWPSWLGKAERTLLAILKCVSQPGESGGDIYMWGHRPESAWKAAAPSAAIRTE